MSKQDRQGVRTPAQLEEKYNLGGSSPQGSEDQKIQIQQLTQTLNQYMVNTNAKLEEIENNTPDIDTTLKIDEEGLLGVNTTEEIKQGNKLPITSEAVATAIPSLVLGKLNIAKNTDIDKLFR